MKWKRKIRHHVLASHHMPFHTHTYSTKNSFLLLKHTNYCVNSSQNLYLCMHLCVCIYKFSSFWKAVKSSLKVTQQIQENILIGCCRSSLPKSIVVCVLYKKRTSARAADYQEPLFIALQNTHVCSALLWCRFLLLHTQGDCPLKAGYYLGAEL